MSCASEATMMVSLVAAMALAMAMIIAPSERLLAALGGAITLVLGSAALFWAAKRVDRLYNGRPPPMGPRSLV